MIKISLVWFVIFFDVEFVYRGLFLIFVGVEFFGICEVEDVVFLNWKVWVGEEIFSVKVLFFVLFSVCFDVLILLLVCFIEIVILFS